MHINNQSKAFWASVKYPRVCQGQVGQSFVKIFWDKSSLFSRASFSLETFLKLLFHFIYFAPPFFIKANF
jgi:hypothetical protein